MTAGPRPSPRQRARDTLRGLGALAVLAVLLVGLPAVLYTVAGAPIPHRLPSPGQLTDTLARRDNGQLFLACLLLLVWAGWAAFTATVAVETLAQLRGRGAPRLPALGGPQRLAGQLVTAVVVAFLGAGPLLAHPGPPGPSAALPVTAPVAAPVAAISVQIPAAAGPHTNPPSTSEGNTPHDASAAGRTAPPAKTYTVARGDTLWGIAETHLGEPERYVEIARLNYGRPQPDGRALTSAHWVYPGWTLVLPPDATGLPSPAHAPTGAADRVAGGQQERAGTGVPQREQRGQQPDAAGSRPPVRGPASPTAARSLATPEPTPSARSHPVPQVTVPPTGQPTGQTHPSGGVEGPGWMEAPLIAGSVAGGLIAALTVLRLRRRRDYQPSQPAPSRTGPQPAPRLQRLAASTHDDVDPAGTTISAARAEDPNAYPRRLSQVEIGQRDGTPVTLDLLAWPGLALTGAGAAPVLRSLLADLLARARHYELQALCDQPTAARLLGDAPPAGDAVRLTDSIGASLMEMEIACVSRNRRFAEAGVNDYDGYRLACPDDPLPLLVLVTTAPPTVAAGQTTSLLTVGRRLGITALILDRPPAEVGTLDISADGQLTAAEPGSLHSQLGGVSLAGLSAGDAATVLTTLAAAAPGGLPAAITRPAALRGAAGPSPEPLADGEDGAASVDPATPSVRCDAPLGGQTAPQPPIAVQLLGPARVTAWGQEISTGLRGSARELLAYFLLQPDGATAEAAIDALWPQVDTERGRQRFWTALGNLRSRLRGPTGSPEVQVIGKHGEHYRPDAALLQVDLWQFQAALGEAQHAAGDPVTEAAALQRAAEIYRGEFADGADYLWAEAAREDLHRRALDALVRLADLRTDQEPQQAIADLDRAIALDPYVEAIYRRLIRLHTAAGRPEAARRSYQQLRDRLADLDLDPDAATEMLIAGGLRVDRHHHQRVVPQPATAPAGPRR